MIPNCERSSQTKTTMDWLIPAITASLVCMLVLVGVYFYLYIVHRERFMGLWTIGWGASALRLIFELLRATHSDVHHVWLSVAVDFSALTNALFLLWGTYELLERRMPQGWVLVTAAIGIWSVFSNLLGLSFLQETVPIFFFLGTIMLWTGHLMFTIPTFSGAEKRMVGWTFALWGLHRLDYPFLRPVVWFAPWGYLMAAFFQFFVAISMVMMYFRRNVLRLEESEGKFRRIVQTTAEGILVLNSDGAIQFSNPRMGQILGVNEQEMMGRPFASFLCPDSPSNVSQLLAHRNSNEPFSREFCFLHRNGSKRWGLVTSSPIIEDENRHEGALAMVTDITDRKMAEEFLLRSEELNRRIISAVPGGIVMVDHKGAIVQTNEPAQELLGLTYDEITDRYIQDFDSVTTYEDGTHCPVEDYPVSRCLATGQPHGPVTIGTRRPDGVITWANYSAIPLFDHVTHLQTGAVVTFIDITQRKLAEVTLRESEQRYRSLVTAMAEGLVFYDETGIIRACNPAAEEILGIRSSELIGLTTKDFEGHTIRSDGAPFPPSEHPATISLNTGRPCSQVIMGIRKLEGNLTWLSMNSEPLVYPDASRPHGVVVSFSDITERVRVREALERARDELEVRVIERTADLELAYRRQSALAEIELAISQPHELAQVLQQVVATVTQHLPASAGASVILWDTTTDEMSVGATTLKFTEDHSHNNHVRRQGGATRWIVDHRQPLFINDMRHDPFGSNPVMREMGIKSYAGIPLLAEREILGVLYAVEYEPKNFTGEDLVFLTSLASRAAAAIIKVRLYDDLKKANIDLEKEILERRRIELALRGANKQLESFSYSVSHDLRAPLRAIIGFADIINRRYRSQLSEEGQEYLDHIQHASNRMGLLIDDLLAYSRLGQRGINRRHIELKRLFDQIQQELQTRDNHVSRCLKFPDDPPGLISDETLLFQILMNLIDNALKYRNPDVEPLVEVECELDETSFCLSVRDNGIGIAPEYHEKIFHAFQRLHTEQAYPGTGIGLATVKKSVDLLNGRISVQSIPENGTTFTIYLPLVQALV